MPLLFRPITLTLGAMLYCTCAAYAYDLNGAIVDAAGKPVAGASVWIAQNHQVHTAKSDDTGAFKVSSLEPGPTEAVAYKEGLAVGGVSCHLTRSEQVQIVLLEPDTLQLRIIDPTFEPVEGARLKYVFIANMIPVALDDLESQGFPAYRSGADGEMAIPILPKGFPAGFVVAHRKFADLLVPLLPVGGERQSVQIYPGTPLRGRVANEKGEGVGGAEVSIIHPGPWGNRIPQELITDPEGYYSTVVRPGAYSVRATHKEYAPSDAADATIERLLEKTTDLVLPAAHYLDGTILGPDGKPFGGVWVVYLMNEKLYQRAMTDVNGKYELKVKRGDGRVHILPPDGYTVAKTLDTLAKIEDVPRVELPPVQLSTLPEVEGVVVGPDGKAPGRVLISSLDLDPPRWDLSDENGRFAMHFARIPGQAKARFRVEHARRFQQAEFTVDFTDIKPLNIQLEAYEPEPQPNNPSKAYNDLSSLVDKPAPPLACASWFNSPALTLDALKGKVIVLAFWGGFADRGPVFDHIEELRALFELLQGVEDVAIISVHDSSVDEEMARDYVGKFRVGFPVGYDTEEGETFKRYETTVMPQTVLIGKDGLVRYFEVDGRLLELIKCLRR